MENIIQLSPKIKLNINKLLTYDSLPLNQLDNIISPGNNNSKIEINKNDKLSDNDIERIINNIFKQEENNNTIISNNNFDKILDDIINNIFQNKLKTNKPSNMEINQMKTDIIKLIQTSLVQQFNDNIKNQDKTKLNKNDLEQILKDTIQNFNFKKEIINIDKINKQIDNTIDYFKTIIPNTNDIINKQITNTVQDITSSNSSEINSKFDNDVSNDTTDINDNNIDNDMSDTDNDNIDNDFDFRDNNDNSPQPFQQDNDNKEDEMQEDELQEKTIQDNNLLELINTSNTIKQYFQNTPKYKQLYSIQEFVYQDFVDNIFVDGIQEMMKINQLLNLFLLDNTLPILIIKYFDEYKNDLNDFIIYLEKKYSNQISEDNGGGMGGEEGSSNTNVFKLSNIDLDDKIFLFNIVILDLFKIIILYKYFVAINIDEFNKMNNEENSLTQTKFNDKEFLY